MKKEITLKDSPQKLAKIKKEKEDTESDVNDYLDVFKGYPQEMKKEIIKSGKYPRITDHYELFIKLSEAFGGI